MLQDINRIQNKALGWGQAIKFHCRERQKGGDLRWSLAVSVFINQKVNNILLGKYISSSRNGCKIFLLDYGIYQISDEPTVVQLELFFNCSSCCIFLALR